MATHLPSLSSKSHSWEPRRPTPMEGVTMAAQRVPDRGTAELLAYCLFDKSPPQAGAAPGGPMVRALTLLLALSASRQTATPSWAVDHRAPRRRA